MKKLFVISVLFLFFFQVYAGIEPKWSNEKLYWDYLKTNFLTEYDYKYTRYTSDIHIQLVGNYSTSDSVIVQKIISELRDLIQTVNIKYVHKKGNLILNINNVTDSMLKGKSDQYCAIGNSDIQYAHIGGSMEGDKLLDIQSAIKYGNLTTNSELEKVYRFCIVRMILAQCFSDCEPLMVQPMKGSMLSVSAPLEVSLMEIDKFIIYKLYTKNFYRQFAFKYPLSFFHYLRFEYRNLFLLLVICISCMICFFYYIWVFKSRLSYNPVKPWLTFIKNGMFILEPLVIFIFCGIAINGLRHITIQIQIADFFGHILMVNCVCFIILNFTYFAEKILLKDVEIPLKHTFLQLFISLISIVLALVIFRLFMDYSINSAFALPIVIFGIVMSIARFAYNYLEYKTQNTIKEKDLELTHLREMQQKAELQALQSRINPHFLYNSLNSIAGLAKTDPEKTEHMAMALSDFCRYAINKQNETFSTVEEEAEMAKTYLKIEKTRFGEQFSYSIDVSDECRKAMIPRFVIQPLIENAIKHGVAKITKTGVVKLQVIKSPEGVKLSIFDNGPGFPDMPVSGYGLQSIYDKLELLFKGKASMNWVNSPEKCIFITIPYSLA